MPRLKFERARPSVDFIQFTGTNLDEVLAELNQDAFIVVLFDKTSAPWLGVRPTPSDAPEGMRPLAVGTWLAWDPAEKASVGRLIRLEDDGTGQPKGFERPAAKPDKPTPFPRA